MSTGETHRHYLTVPAILRANGFTRVCVEPGLLWSQDERAWLREYTPSDRRLTVPAENLSRSTMLFAIQLVLGEQVSVPWGYYVDSRDVPYRALMIYIPEPDAEVDAAEEAFNAEVAALSLPQVLSSDLDLGLTR